MALENQRYGRNKDTFVNKTYIDSGEYKRKFDTISNNKEVNRTVHPHSMPPSAADFNAAYLMGYSIGVVVCHNGRIFCYRSKAEISVRICEMYAEEFMSVGYTEYESQILALEKFKEYGMIDFWEVK